jgi:hypothetical protein
MSSPLVGTISLWPHAMHSTRMKLPGPRSSMRAAWSGTIAPRSDVRCLFPHRDKYVTPPITMSAFGRSRHDERSKKEQRFRRPERARISWGKAMRGRGPGEGPNLSALGVAALRCALLKQVQPGMRVQTSAIAAGRSGPCRLCVRHTWSRRDAPSNGVREFQRHAVGPSRRGPAQSDGRTPGTTRLIAHRPQRCRRKLPAGRGSISCRIGGK